MILSLRISYVGKHHNLFSDIVYYSFQVQQFEMEYGIIGILDGFDKSILISNCGFSFESTIGFYELADRKKFFSVD